MAAPVREAGVLTFVFTDIAGSTRLWERAPEAMRLALRRHDAIIGEISRGNGGKVFKTVGDAAYCVFAGAADAVRAAVAMQRALGLESWPPAIGRLRVRIGVHTGPAVGVKSDYFGPTLNRVARLMSAGHGGQILLSDTTASLVRDVLRAEMSLLDLGAHRLKDLTTPETIFQIVAPGLENDFPPPATLDAQPNNLPSQLSTFVGREREIGDIRDLLATHRLVTISGPGGIGKTRLALQIAADSIGRFKDGSWIVRFEDLEVADLAPQAIASVLHIQETPGQAIVETLVEALAAKRLFLLLDDSERIVVTVAKLVRRILNECPNVSILVTSREPLHVDGEQVVRIGPLALPDGAATLDTLERSEATQLFLARARQHDVTYAFQAADAQPIFDLCCRLEGIPLAIELAAARVPTFGVAELNRRLQTSLKMLVSKDHSKSERHKTLQSTIDWSYRLLAPEEQRFFARLSIFEGGFTLHAVDALAADAHEDEAAELLDVLADKSLITVLPENNAVRYRLLDLLREFACERLVDFGERETTARVHFSYFAAFAERWGDWPDDAAEQRYLAELERDTPNMRAALTWGLAQADKAPAIQLLQKMGVYWQLRCHIREARAWFDRALQNLGDTAAQSVAALLRRAATLATIEDDYDVARRLTLRCLELYETLGERSGQSEALHNLAVIEDRCGNTDAAYALYARALNGFIATNHKNGTITALYNLAASAMKRGEPAEAQALFERGIALCDTPAESDKRATFLMARGEISFVQGRLDEAERFFNDALQLKRELGSEFDAAEVLRDMTLVHIRRADWAGAFERAREGLACAIPLQLPSLTLSYFETFALICWNDGRAQEAEELFALAQNMRDETHYSLNILREVDSEMNVLRAALATDSFQQCRERMRSVDWRRRAEALVIAPRPAETVTG